MKKWFKRQFSRISLRLVLYAVCFVVIWNQHLFIVYRTRQGRSMKKFIDVDGQSYKIMCPNGLEEHTEALMCKKPIQFNKRYKNPCWTNSTGSLFCLPYFLIIGMQKCGTTDLYTSIIKHEDIEPPRGRFGGVLKELHFFDAYHYAHKLNEHDPDMFLTFHNYVSKFSAAAEKIKENGNIITGEATPAYLWRYYTWYLFPENRDQQKPLVLIPDQVHHLLPDVKLIIILRDPVDRTRSSYFYFHGDENKGSSFEEAMDQGLMYMKDCFRLHDERSCLFNKSLVMPFEKQVDHILPGLYYYFIQEWLRVFPREQILILSFEDYKKNKAANLNKVFKFLDISTKSVKDMESSGMISAEVENKGQDISQDDLNQGTFTKLRQFFQPYNKLLYNLLLDNGFSQPGQFKY